MSLWFIQAASLNHYVLFWFAQGMEKARGQYLLFADADGATQFSDLDKLTKSMLDLAPKWQTEAIVIGSRAHLEDEAIATRSFFR